MGRLEGKTAIITGGTKGLGEAAARRFVKEGARVVIAGRSEEDGRRLEAELGEGCLFFRLDVTDYENWKECIAFVRERLGLLDILINNAGISVAENIAEASPESYDQIIDVNQKGVFYGMKLAIEAMRENPPFGDPAGEGPATEAQGYAGQNSSATEAPGCAGQNSSATEAPGYAGQAAPSGRRTCSIVNTASIDGVVGDSLYFAYCASKAAVEAMTRCAALYCGEHGLPIRVNAVAPGYILTPMAEQDAAERGMTIEEYEREMAKDHPIGYIGRPEDIANAYLYLASDEAAFVTGTTLAVDGGYTAK